MPTPTILWGSQSARTQQIDTALEQAVGKTQSLVHLAQPWAFGRALGLIKYQQFPVAALQTAYDRGSLVMLDWASWDLAAQQDPAFALDIITTGQHDAYLHAWAQAAAAWQHPFLLRFDAEMNGNWEPYGAQPTAFVKAWQYVHDIFAAEGASNVTWCWCPNVCAPAGTQWSTATDKLSQYYPGDQYVDWTGFDAYNWSVGDKGPWRTFDNLMHGLSGWLGDTYSTILKIAPSKPMALAEFGCWDDPRRPAWLLDALTAIPVKYPQIAAISYFNWDGGSAAKWPLTDPASQAAFKQAIASPVWLAASDWMPPDMQPFGGPTVNVGPTDALERQVAALQATTVQALADRDAAQIAAGAAQIVITQAAGHWQELNALLGTP